MPYCPEFQNTCSLFITSFNDCNVNVYIVIEIAKVYLEKPRKSLAHVEENSVSLRTMNNI